MEVDDYKISVHVVHGGGFRDHNTYFGGKTTVIDDVDWVYYHFENLEATIKSWGYHSVLRCAFRGFKDRPKFSFFSNEEVFDSGLFEHIDKDSKKLIIYVECLDDDFTIVEKGKGEVDKGKEKSKIDESLNPLDKIFEQEATRSPVISEYELSDDSRLSLTSDEELGHKRSRKKVAQKNFKTDTEKKNFRFEVGMKFLDYKECKDAIRDWAVENGYNIWWKKSDEKKIEARCDGRCPWMLYVSKLAQEATFVVKTILDEHTCIRGPVNRQATKEWLAGFLTPRLKRNPNYPATEMVHDVHMRYGIYVTKDLCYKAKWKALEKIHGSVESHYKLLRSYFSNLHEMDKEGRFLLKTRLDVDDRPIFERAYVGFSSLRKGYLVGCRKCVCFDACFLKARVGGCLLAAVAKDCNSKMWPISWAVVEKECEDSWSWFFEILFEDLGIGDGLGWTFMSDQHKGIINGISKLAPNAEHRHCARHIYDNWKKDFPGRKFKKMFWDAVLCTSETDFRFYTSLLKDCSEEGYNQFMARDPSKFCRSFISSYTKTDMVENNICETFNSYCKRAREKPIINMLEDIRINLMTRMPEIVRALEASSDILCPAVLKKLGDMQELVQQCTIRASMETNYEVHVNGDVVTVDLVRKYCSCRSWSLTGIPCFHALACIRHARHDPVKYIDEFYYRVNCIAAYKNYLSPIRGRRGWPVDDQHPILPPPYERMPGRPKKNRRKDASEEPRQGKQKLKKDGTRMSCSKCKSTGHNARTCKGIPLEQQQAQEQPRRKAGRPRKSSNAVHEIDMRQARSGFGVLTGQSGNIYVRPPGAKRTTVLRRGGASQSAGLDHSSQDISGPGQSSQFVAGASQTSQSQCGGASHN